MKGIILAGGSGTRLYPITIAMSKQLMPIYDKLMIYYPLATLMSARIKKILIITTLQARKLLEKMLGDGSQLGCDFKYACQIEPKGLAEAFIIGEKFNGKDKVALVLGDSIFYGSGLADLLQANNDPNGGIIYGHHLQDPQRYEVVEFNKEGKAINIEEKPSQPKSNYAVPRIYFYDDEVIGIAKNINPSKREELEITDINRAYLEKGKLKVSILARGTAWLNTGTFASLVQASEFVEVIEDRQGLKIGAIEQNCLYNGVYFQRSNAHLSKTAIKKRLWPVLAELNTKDIYQ